MLDQPPDDQAREFAAAFLDFLNWVYSAAGGGRGNEVSALVREFLGPDGAHHSVVTRELPRFEHVNLQTAVDAWSARAGRTSEVRGIALPPHYGGLSYVVMIQAPSEHQPGLQIEVAGLPVDLAQRLLAELDQLRAELNVYRGHLLEVSLDPMGGVNLSFASPPGIGRDDVVLPATVLARVERHALGVAAHREALLAAGQHLKRGLLLYGPPGTGKTHTTRYLLGQMSGYTRLVLTGRSLVAVGGVTDLARALLPAVVVLEDVDLVAEERSHGPASSPVLFDLLDAMDGAAPAADLLFLLTTNRADLLEPALAARPGRVDVAVEIALPDAPARERLLTLYGRNVPLALPTRMSTSPSSEPTAPRPRSSRN